MRETTVTAVGDPTVTEDQARVEVELTSGERIQKNVDHAIGNLGRPMTDRELEEKFHDQAARVLPATRCATDRTVLEVGRARRGAPARRAFCSALTQMASVPACADAPSAGILNVMALRAPKI